MQINPYLYFEGNCAEALAFYEKALGAKVGMTITHGNSPMAANVGPEWQDKIMHTSFTVGETVFMASDAPPAHFHRAAGFALNIPATTVEQADSVYAALSEGGVITVPLAETFWTKRFGMFRDKFGIPWMINLDAEQPA